PEVVEGADGQVVNANNRWGPPDGPMLARRWHPDLRHRRAVALLDASSAHDVESFRIIQADVHSQDADLLLPLLLARADPAPGPAADAVERLADWNREMAPDSVGATIFAAWLRELNRELFADDLDATFASFWNYNAPLVARLVETDSPWCDNVTTTDTEDCAAVTAAALDRAVAWLTANLSADMNEWQWGRLHQA